MGVFAPAGSGLPDAVREAGGEPVVLPFPAVAPVGGVALHREWAADYAQVHAAREAPSALLLDAPDPAREPAPLVGMLLAALRLNLPVAVASPPVGPLPVALCALGFAPLGGETGVEVSVRLARDRKPRPRKLVDGFSLANALRAGLAAGGGPELLVHLMALAGEVDEFGFGRTMRVLFPESPALPGLYSDAPALLAALGDVLNDTATVSGPLKEALPEAPETPPEAGSRLGFIRGRASGIEAVVSVPAGVEEFAREFSGKCRVFGLESRAARAVERGMVKPGELIVATGYGPRGGPGLSRLELLHEALRETGSLVPVVTDGLPPEGEMLGVPWVSLFTPEAAGSEGVLGLLRDGDFLRVIHEESRLRTDVGAGELADRSPRTVRSTAVGYAARYAAAARPAFDGAGFGPAD